MPSHLTPHLFHDVRHMGPGIISMCSVGDSIWDSVAGADAASVCQKKMGTGLEEAGHVKGSNDFKHQIRNSTDPTALEKTPQYRYALWSEKTSSNLRKEGSVIIVGQDPIVPPTAKVNLRRRFGRTFDRLPNQQALHAETAAF